MYESYIMSLKDETTKWILTIDYDEDDPEIGQPWKSNYDPDLDRILMGKLGL